MSASAPSPTSSGVSSSTAGTPTETSPVTGDATHNRPLDLALFYADPTVTVDSQTGTVMMEEEPEYSTAVLSNTLEDDEIAITSDGNSVLVLDYEFVEGEAQNDSFIIILYDAEAEKHLDKYYVRETSRNQVVFDISGYESTTIGIDFALESYDSHTGSTVKLSNLRTEACKGRCNGESPDKGTEIYTPPEDE